jgi:hypothetical protein
MRSDAGGRGSVDPFEHRRTKDGRVLIRRGGRVVVTLAGAAADRLHRAIQAAEDEETVQHLLARATGNYRRGNERGR